jgi:hypothetical protein
LQTFLPDPDFAKSAELLDYRRLGQQRRECIQIINVLDISNDKNGWANHPAVKMWRGYPFALIEYGVAMSTEWIRRGYRDTRLPIFYDLWEHGRFEHFGDIELKFGNSTRPPWMGDPAFHRSHQSNLIRKDPEHYGPLFRGVPDDLPYVWPEEATRAS